MAPDAPIQVLSIQSPILGNRTVGLALREHFRHSERTRWDSFWMDEQRELMTRVMVRLLDWRFPWAPISSRNLDGSRFRAELAYGILGRRLASRMLRHHGYGVLHFHTQVPAFCSADIMRRIPTVVSTDLTVVQAAAEHGGSRYRWTFRPNIALERRCFRAARRIVVFSEWTRHAALQAYPFARDKVTVVYPGVDLRRIDPRRAPPAPDRPRILFIGGDFRRKGGPDLLDVFVHSLGERAELDLVTNAPLTITHPAVHLHRGVETYSARWRSLLSGASFFVLPTYAEGFGLAFLEAMAAGLPVIGTRVGAVPELVREGETGFLIDAGDRRALAERSLRLLDDPELATRMGRRARAVAEQRFDSRRNLDTFEDVLVEATHQGPPARAPRSAARFPGREPRDRARGR